MNRFSKSIAIIISIVLSISAVSCGPNQSLLDSEALNQENRRIAERLDDETKEQLLQLVNNEDKADDLIKTTYPEDVLNNLSVYIYDVIEQNPPECVRYIEESGMLYFVYKSDTGHYAFWLYSFVDNAGVVVAKWYCGKHISLAEFAKKKDENATLDDVKEFDPCGEYSSLSLGGLYTFHHTVDGYCIRLDYVNNTISTITKLDNLLYDYMLDIDKELLSDIG